MIVPMKKLSALLYHREKEEFLQTLRDVGVVHIKEGSNISSEEMVTFLDKQKKVSAVLSALKKDSSKTEQKKEGSAEDIIERYYNTKAEVDKYDQEIQNDKKLISDVEPWGEFDPETINKLIGNGLKVKLLSMSHKKFEELDKSEMTYEVINKIGSTIYFVLVEKEDKIEMDVEETFLPELSLSLIKARLEKFTKKRQELTRTLSSLSAYYNVVLNYSRSILEKVEFETARLSMEEKVEGTVLSFTGWYPKEEEKKVIACLDKFSCWYETVEPLKDEGAPVKLKNKSGFNLFEPLTGIFSLPDYFELDPTPFFAPFYAFFFGLCLGDVGYGALLALLAGIGFVKVSSKMKPVMMLGVILGISTMVSGLLLNTIFGAPIFAELNSGTFSAAILAPRNDLSGVFPAMSFSIYLGVIQVILGMTLKAVNRFREGGFQYVLYPLGTILLTFAVAGSLIKINFLDMALFWEVSFPGVMTQSAVTEAISWITVKGLVVTGLILVFLFNNPDKKIGARLPLGFWELYNFATGIMGDGLSYIRLFALGLAGGLLGAAFNQIGFMLITGEDGAVHYNSILIIFTVLILVLGHVINFALAAIGSFVHPLRLTFVEFYNNLEFKGGSKPFKPFAKTINN